MKVKSRKDKTKKKNSENKKRKIKLMTNIHGNMETT